LKWTVDWIPPAENRLAELWCYAPDRNAITQAADEIDRILAIDPENRGVPYYGGRMLFQPPLAVSYTVDRNRGVVEVIQVDRISQ
jgi:hypothetical protein